MCVCKKGKSSEKGEGEGETGKRWGRGKGKEKRCEHVCTGITEITSRDDDGGCCFSAAFRFSFSLFSCSGFHRRSLIIRTA